MNTQPWYKHRWPWILISGPAIVVVACVVTFVLAVRSFDGFVVDPKEKKGLVIERAVPAQEPKPPIMDARHPGG